MINKISGTGCSKLTTSLVNVSLKFQTLTSQISRNFLLKKMCKAFALKLLSFFQEKISVYLVKKSKNTLRVDLLTSSLSLRCFEQLGPER